jgi:hypothetical protein
MKKTLTYLFVLLIGIGCAFVACNKENKSETPVETIIRTDSTRDFGSLTPTTVNVSNNRANIYFVQTPLVFTLNLREKGSKQYLDLINTAIKKDIPVAVSIYKHGGIGSMLEIAGIKDASPLALEKFAVDYTPKKPLLISKEEDIVPIPSEALMNLMFTACQSDPVQTFAYKADGCYARAHEMRKVLEDNGYACGKLFIYASSTPLAVSVSSSCCQTWSFHVAPLVRFYDASGVAQVRIFDPSLFSTPVTKDQWFAACKSSCFPGANIGSTFLAQPYVYNRATNGSIARDNNYSKTQCTLNAYAGYSGGCFSLPGACSW